MSASTYNDVSAANAATVSNRFNENLMYDLRGNILTMNRTGYYTDAGSCLYNTIDNLTYNYAANTNKLTSITDASATAPKPKGFNPGSGGAGFGYDLVGNLVSDTYKGITSITYNYLNLPSTIAWGTTKSIDFVYDASGNKLIKTVKTGAIVNSIQDYVMGVEYNKLGAAARKIESVYHSEGRYFNTSTTSTPSWRTEYSIKDHLGNSRISFTDKNLNGKIDVDNTVNNEILQESHYYSFGMGFDGTWQINDAAKDNYYMYNSKELNIDHALNWSDYGARWYDACLGRWSCVDPLADKYIGWSPYNYVMNNPISKIDPDGMDVWDALSRLQSRVRNNQYEEERKSAKEDNDVVANNHKSGQESGSGSISAQSGVDYNCDCGCPGMPPCKNKSSSEISRGIDLLISTIRTGLGMSPNTGSETGDKNLQQMMLLMPLFGGIGTKNKVTSNALRFSELDKLTFLKFTESWIGKGGDIIARGNKIEDLSRLLMQYGGKTDDWAKMTGKPLIRKGFTIEVHWY